MKPVKDATKPTVSTALSPNLKIRQYANDVEDRYSKNPQNRNQFSQNSLFSFLLKGHLSRKETERFPIIWLRNLR